MKAAILINEEQIRLFLEDGNQVWSIQKSEVPGFLFLKSPGRPGTLADIETMLKFSKGILEMCQAGNETFHVLHVPPPQDGGIIIWSMPALPGKNCEWNYADDIWKAACGGVWQFEVDGPEENGTKYCPFCGRQMLVIKDPDNG